MREILKQFCEFMFLVIMIYLMILFVGIITGQNGWWTSHIEFIRNLLNSLI